MIGSPYHLKPLGARSDLQWLLWRLRLAALTCCLTLWKLTLGHWLRRQIKKGLIGSSRGGGWY